MRDHRNIETGREIPSEGYCDQPYAVVNDDGSWTCVMTTGKGREGEAGQHVVSVFSADRGRTWEGPFDIEPADGPEASWAMPLRAPETGRIYVFYTYNRDNLREVLTVDGRRISRVDSLGAYAYKYSDDFGRSWSRERFEIPMRRFKCDRNNAHGGEVLFFWGVGKPFTHKGAAYVCASKVGGFGKGFFAQNEGVLFRSPNLLTEPDPAKHEWETLPEGEIGLRAPSGGGPIAGEFNATPMNDGALYGTLRTIDGWSCHAYSRDDGRTWDVDWMTYVPGGRRVKNPRGANFVRRFSNGKYLYWFYFNGGEVLGRHPQVANAVGYTNRNPVWLCGGVEKDGRLHWSQPEIVLYDPKIGNGMSYPDFIEDGGRIFLTETQKTTARTHEIDQATLDALWSDDDVAREAAMDGLVLDVEADACGAGTSVAMPPVPLLSDGEGEGRAGFSLEMWVRFDDLTPWQTLFDSRDEGGAGLRVMLGDRGTVELRMTGQAYDLPGARFGNGWVESAWECDQDLLKPGDLHQILFIVDGGPKIISVMIDGVLCDGGPKRRCGWGRFHPNLSNVNGAERVVLASGLRGELKRARLYDRPLFFNEGVTVFQSFSPGCPGT